MSACRGRGSRTLKAIDIDSSAAGLFAEAEARELPGSRPRAQLDAGPDQQVPSSKRRQRAAAEPAVSEEEDEEASAEDLFDKLKEANRGAPRDVQAALTLLYELLQRQRSVVARLEKEKEKLCASKEKVSEEKEQLVEQNQNHARERVALEGKLKAWTKAFRQREEELAEAKELIDGLQTTNMLLRRELKGMAQQQQRRREVGAEEGEAPPVLTPVWKRVSANPKPPAQDKSPASAPGATASPTARKTPSARGQASRSPAREPPAAVPAPAAAPQRAANITAPVAAAGKRREEKAAADAAEAAAKARSRAAPAAARAKRAAELPAASSDGKSPKKSRASPSPKRSRASPAPSAAQKASVAAEGEERARVAAASKDPRGARRLKWTMGEVAELEKYVAKYGQQWSYILEKGRFHPKRISVDLKDKWRNLNKGL